MLQLNSLVKAIQSLEVALTRWEATPTDQEIRDSVVKRFEYTYELCHKMLRRQLQEMSAIPTEVVALDYKSLIREGAKFKLIARPDAWFAYRRQRNLTSHTYDESVAEEVAKNAIEFLEDARQLLLALQKNE